ncbi:MAG: hypothetical protein B7Y37_11695 [Sphingobacteriia bacterium 28-36-52]|nr:MAG: hypothetical protein B7Y37_11695 [Sphingobacteriia bacterium 28-36-52]
MKWIFTLLSIFLFQYAQAQQVNWNGYRISYIGKTSISKKMDANQNTKLRIENISNNAALPIYFDLFIEGFTAPSTQRNLHGEFGFATFPNGGAIQVPVGQQSFAQTWTQGVYEDRMGNIPPQSGTSKTYKMHFLFSENQGDLQGPYPKNAATVLDFPVDIQFVNDDTVQLYRSGNKAIRLALNAKSAGNFNLELFTEAGGPQQATNLFQNTLVQAGNGSNTPYTFDFKLALRNDWYVKIRKPGKKSEYFKLDTAQAVNTFSLAEETIATSPFTVRLIKSIKTKTGFWRGAVSETTKSFVCIPGQENWATTSSAKNASRLYKIDFDGNIQWTKDIGWEAWGGDMTSDGKFVAVASNGMIGPTPLNGNRGGDFIAILNGADGAVYDTIFGIQSRNIKFSSDAKHLAIGDQNGTFHVYDMTTKKLVLNKFGFTSYGQNRELVWIENNSAIVISTGDGNLYRYNLSADKQTATLVWKAFTGGWGFINGLTVSKDGLYIGTGTKSKDQTIVNAATGAVIWTKYTGLFDVSFTPDANRMATFGGYIFRTDNGNFLGHTGRAGVAAFSPDGKYLMQADRVQVTNGQYGDNAVSIMNDIGDKLVDVEGKSNYYDSLDLTNSGGEQVQWAYWSEDGKRIIVLSRDMDLSEEVGISIFSLETCSIAAPSVTNITLCQSATTSILSATALSGNTLRWYGTNATGGTAATTAPTPSSSTAGQTIYYVSQFNAGSNCESPRAALTVTINPLPATPTITASTATSFCTGGSVVLNSSSASGNQWYKDGALISGATNASYTASQSGSYTVKVTNASNCESAASAASAVTVNALPAVPTITASTATSLCTGGSVVLSSSATAGNQWLKDGTPISGATNQTYTANQAGVYTVSVTNASSCASISASGITVTLTATPAKPTITQTGADLVSSANAGNQWFREASSVAGATSQTYRPLTSGNYTVRVTVNGCASPMSDSYFYLVTSVVNTTNASGDYRIYPNPVKDNIFIDAGSTIQKINYQIFDSKGRRVMSNSFTKSVLINFSNYSNGAYTILLTNSKTMKQESKQIIKQ